MNFAVSAFALFVLTVIMHIYDKHLNRFMIRDYEPISIRSGKSTYEGSTFSLFMKSGFFLLLIPVIIRCLVGQGSKTLAPLMLNETFGTEPSFGNLLNVLIIVAGLCGTLLVKLVLYPRIVKNELAGLIVCGCILLGFTATFVFASTVSLVVVSLCGIALFSTAASLFISYFNASFAKYGKNGTAAGISNAAASFGIVLLNYGILKISEIWGWASVRYLWLIFVMVLIICSVCVFFISKRFRKTEISS